MKKHEQSFFGFEYTRAFHSRTGNRKPLVLGVELTKSVPGILHQFNSSDQRDNWVEQNAKRVVVHWNEIRSYFWGLSNRAYRKTIGKIKFHWEE